ncbi:MAG TPA: serine/threonine-protein kinase, partial [Nannocystaceae bacterium]|nr:serine/threonine-protein kinase [Nannocystaceae bacterium]
MREEQDEAATALLAAAERWDPVEERLAIAGIQERMFGRPRRPKSVARYILLEPLGGGAMGLVWRAYDPTLDRKVAVKLIRAVPGARAEAHAALLREAQTIAGVSHPNVVAVFDTGTYDEREVFGDADGVGVFLVMELVEGPTLQQWLGERERKWREVVEVMLAAARGLAAVHRRGLVHRDVKPANVLIGDPVRVADFGLAAAAVAQPDHDAPRVIAGTPGYMAPEQYEGRFDARSDQFAFCVTLWRALYGHVPATPSSTKGQRREREAAIPMQPPNSSVPRWLHAIVVRGLQTDPADRWSDMDALVRALGRDPARTARRVAAVVLATGTALGLGLLLGQPRGGPCADDPMQAVWNPALADEVEQRFVAARVPFASESMAFVRRGLDAYAQTWREGWQRVCATSTEAAQQAELACLQRGLHRVGGLVEMLRSADPLAVERAAFAVDELPRPRECVSDERAAASWAVPASRGDVER